MGAAEQSRASEGRRHEINEAGAMRQPLRAAAARQHGAFSTRQAPGCLPAHRGRASRVRRARPGSDHPRHRRRWSRARAARRAVTESGRGPVRPGSSRFAAAPRPPTRPARPSTLRGPCPASTCSRCLMLRPQHAASPRPRSPLSLIGTHPCPVFDPSWRAPPDSHHPVCPGGQVGRRRIWSRWHPTSLAWVA